MTQMFSTFGGNHEGTMLAIILYVVAISSRSFSQGCVHID
jgi:hypothetical protein